MSDTAADAKTAAREIADAAKGLDSERADLLAALAQARHFLRYPARDLTDEQARQRTTVSELTIGGLVKHVTEVERGWADFIVHGAGSAQKSFDQMTPEDWANRENGFRLLDGETLQGVLDDYARAAAETDELIRTHPSLDAAHALPEAPWYPPNTAWTARRVIAHIIAETAQHAGHADIIRESLDGGKSMG
ncbi:MAG TPA: DinB family protein [Trebonia sp.]|jgi:uncharacterized damage-inducible protein DinB|nr:DinB family protein [Trebonia sp.]